MTITSCGDDYLARYCYTPTTVETLFSGVSWTYSEMVIMSPCPGDGRGSIPRGFAGRNWQGNSLSAGHSQTSGQPFAVRTKRGALTTGGILVRFEVHVCLRKSLSYCEMNTARACPTACIIS